MTVHQVNRKNEDKGEGHRGEKRRIIFTSKVLAPPA